MELSSSVITFSVCFLLPFVCGHGRLMDPPSRSSLWRVGYATPKNNNDGELNCGGFSNQWYVLQGKCGICGDPWQDPTPRKNEAGGLYGEGIITKTYSTGQDIQISVRIQHNHGGWFEFRLCANNNPKKMITQSCLDEHLLQLNGGDTRYFVAGHGDAVDVVVSARLPVGLTCSQCVLQWKWNGGDQFGMDPNGTACFGCGHQEEYYGCSDIAIRTATSPQQSTPTRQSQTHLPVVTTKRLPSTTTAQTPPPMITTKQLLSTPTPVPTNYFYKSPPKQTSNGSCHGINQWAGDPQLDQWCVTNCARGLCPPMNCDCSGSVPTKANQPSTKSVVKTQNCRGAHLWSGIASLDHWCNINCATGLCPPVYCECPGSVTPSPASLTQSIPPFNLPTMNYPLPVLKSTTSKLFVSPTHGIPSPLVPVALQTRVPPYMTNTSPPRSANPHRTSTQAHTTVSGSTQSASTLSQTTSIGSTQSASTLSQTTSIGSTQSGPCHAINTWKGIALLDKFCNNVCINSPSSRSKNNSSSYNNMCSPLYCECNFP